MMLEPGAETGRVVGFTVRFRAPRDKVFATWTRPELVQKWFFAEAGYRTHDVHMDLQPLGPWQIVVTPADAGEPTRIHGHFVEVDPERSLVYTWTGACAEEQYLTLVTARFVDEPEGGSRIELEHGVFRTDADRAMHEQGWVACIAALDALLGQ